MSIRSRLERLERLECPPSPRVSIWDVLCGARDVADLDDADQALFQEMLDAADAPYETVEDRMWAALADSARAAAATGGPGP